MNKKGMLIDVSKCTACRGCQVACKQWWKLPAVSTTNRGTHENPPDLSPETWNKIRFREISHNGTVRWLFTRQSCMHCTKAACVWLCPTYARGYHELGFITIDLERCIDCGRCVTYCPFEVPKLGGQNVSTRIPVKLGGPRMVAYNCAFCRDRVENGLTPACAKTCPTGAIQFDERSNLIKQGRARVTALKTTYPKAQLYGERELGGLHLLYVLTDEPSIHGLPENPQMGTYPEFSGNTFPDWYIQAVAEGKLPAFPPGVRSEWYMQPKLVPAPRRKEPAWPVAAAKPGLGWAAKALWGWVGVGVIGGATALWWSIRRRNRLGEEKQKDGET